MNAVKRVMREWDMVWVAGLHRSGTSLLHFLVGALPGYIALGEILSLIDNPDAIARADTSTCSCGSTIAACSFWGQLLPQLKGDGDYAPVIDHFRKRYPGQVAVDSSKDYRTVLTQMPDARVILCIRDVRAWAVSNQCQSVRGFVSWYRRNRALMNALKDRTYLTIGYGEATLRPDETFQRMADYLGIAEPPDWHGFGRAEHHAVHVNRMKDQPEKMAAIQYDYRWFTEKKWLIPSLLLPPVMKFNRQVVYGHVRDMFQSSPQRSALLDSIAGEGVTEVPRASRRRRRDRRQRERRSANSMDRAR
jgi:hypothetical protein